MLGRDPDTAEEDKALGQDRAGYLARLTKNFILKIMNKALYQPPQCSTRTNPVHIHNKVSPLRRTTNKRLQSLYHTGQKQDSEQGDKNVPSFLRKRKQDPERHVGCKVQNLVEFLKHRRRQRCEQKYNDPSPRQCPQ